MFAKNTSVMLYVDDLATECAFWRAIGFQIIIDECDGPVPYFAMKTAPEDTLTLIVYDRDFIKKASPEVVDNQPSMLFEVADLQATYQLIKKVSDLVSPINNEPFPNFAFQSPAGNFYAVKEADK